VERMEDSLFVGYDNNLTDCPCLVVMRKTDEGCEIVKMVTNDKARKIYKMLTEL